MMFPFLNIKMILLGLAMFLVVLFLGFMGLRSCNNKRAFKKKMIIYKEDTVKRDKKVHEDVQDVVNFNEHIEVKNESFFQDKEITEYEKKKKQEEGRMLHFINQRKLKR